MNTETNTPEPTEDEMVEAIFEDIGDRFWTSYTTFDFDPDEVEVLKSLVIRYGRPPLDARGNFNAWLRYAIRDGIRSVAKAEAERDTRLNTIVDNVVTALGLSLGDDFEVVLIDLEEDEADEEVE